MLRAGLIGISSVLVALAAPALAGAATQVDVEQVSGLDVVVVRNDDGEGQIETRVDTSTAQHFVAVQSAGGATPGNGCQAGTADIVGCPGDFDAIVVFGNG